MKTLFFTVPQWYPMNPYLAPAILAGQMRAAGFEIRCVDLNIKFFNTILTRSFTARAAERAKRMLPGLYELYSSLEEPEKNFDSYDRSVKTKLLRLKTIKEFFERYGEDGTERIINCVEDAVGVLKDPEKFYDPELHFISKDVINDALKINSLPYAPTKILIDNYIANPVLTFSFADVKEQCFDASQNMFIEFYSLIMDSLSGDDSDLIAISITDLSQLIPALTLARMARERYGKPIALGGNYIYKIISEIKEYPEFFDLYCDYILVGDGETAFVELAEFMDGRRDINDVHSLVWFDNGKVITNRTAPLLKLNTLSYPDFDDVDFSEYFSPQTVFPVQLGKGCYWSKCAFCDFYTGQQKFDIKSVEHAADEVEHLVNRYGAEKFIFVDECVPPRFYDLFATEIQKRRLKIRFYSFARFDKGFTKDVLINLQKAGAMYFSWGYEAESPRLLELMNKGIDPDVRARIVRDCVDIGMWTQCTFLLGYPTETPEELQSTIDVIENRELINSCTPSNFALKKNAILKDQIEDVGITDFTSNGDFHVSCSYHSTGASMETVKKNRMDFERRFLKETADCLWSLGFTDTDHLLLYLSKYGRDWVRDYRLKYTKEV